MGIREKVLRLAPHCAMCLKDGKVTPGAEVDHIIPLCKDGTDDLENLQVLCVECHKVKTANDMGYKIKPEIGIDGWPVG
jgi:5-methylcytosine-specific restriction endonuclease McrA